MKPTPLFDAALHGPGLSAAELADVAFFGTEGAVLVDAAGPPPRTPEELLAGLKRLVGAEVGRLRQAGVAPFVALGVHPRRLPPRGLGEVLGELPALFGEARVVAIGVLGLAHADEEETRALSEQLALAQQVGRPVLVQPAAPDEPKAMRRLLALLRESGLPPERALVLRVGERTLPLVRACGHAAALLVGPTGLPPERAVALVRRHGSAGLLLGSGTGDGTRELLALPRTAMLLEKAGLSPEILHRVCRDNALSFYGIDPGALARTSPTNP